MQFTAYEQQSGRVIKRNDDVYRYDECGRLVEKHVLHNGFRPAQWRYRWDDQGQLQQLITPQGERWQYRYDAFGRRISKRRLDSVKGIAGYDYRWSGDQLVAEVPVYADGTTATDKSVYWLYEPGALTPGARYENGELHYVVRDHMGTPRELLTESGKVVWAQKLSVWGRSERYPFSHPGAENDDNVRGPDCPWRFAGQWADEESGLYYNRFRYYDSDTGQYQSPDPIGLVGGLNSYGYVANPLKYIDPLGLAGNPATATHITYPGIDVTTGKPYVGYASMQGKQSAADVLKYRYGGDFSRFGGQAPEILYEGYGQAGKDTARGLEQRIFENLGGFDGTANKQNPVGLGNSRRTEYLNAADEFLNSNKTKEKYCG